MSRGTLIRLGLFAVLLSLVLPVLNQGLQLAEEDNLNTLTGWLLRGAGALLFSALVLWTLEKAGLRVAGARCSDCRRPIQHGRSLCADHLQARVFAARERHHGERGLGV